MNRLFKMRRISPTLAGLIAAVCIAADVWAAEEAADAADIGYYALKPSFVSNLTGGPKYIRCDIQLMTEDSADIPKIELHTPALRHGILMLIGGKDGAQLKTRDGKEELRQAALESVRTQLQELAGKSIVKDLYFTAYYVK